MVSKGQFMENSRYIVVFSNLSFGNHVKKFGSNFKWGIFNASVLLNGHGHPRFFISKLNFSYNKYSVDKV